MKHIYILYQLHFFNEQRILLTFSINSMQHNTLSNLRYPFNYPFPPHTIHNTPLSIAKTCYKTSTSNKKKGKKSTSSSNFSKAKPHPPPQLSFHHRPLSPKTCSTSEKQEEKKKKKKGKHLHPFTFPKPNRADQTKPKNQLSSNSLPFENPFEKQCARVFARAGETQSAGNKLHSRGRNRAESVYP